MFSRRICVRNRRFCSLGDFNSLAFTLRPSARKGGAHVFRSCSEISNGVGAEGPTPEQYSMSHIRVRVSVGCMYTIQSCRDLESPYATRRRTPHNSTKIGSCFPSSSLVAIHVKWENDQRDCGSSSKKLSQSGRPNSHCASALQLLPTKIGMKDQTKAALSFRDLCYILWRQPLMILLPVWSESSKLTLLSLLQILVAR